MKWFDIGKIDDVYNMTPEELQEKIKEIQGGSQLSAPIKCPNCGSTDTRSTQTKSGSAVRMSQKCKACGNTWKRN